jgi:hypothetical protein
MRTLKLLFFFSIYSACIFSCASVSGKDTLYVNLTDRSKFALLPTGGIEQAIDMAQFLTAEFRGQNYFLNAWVKADENIIEMAFFNEMGAGIGELSYINGAVHFSSTVIPKAVIKSLRPEYLIADFQLCFYDPILLGKSLKDSGLIFETKDGNRRILNGTDVIIEINKTKNSIELVNHLRKYAFFLEGDFYVQ